MENFPKTDVRLLTPEQRLQNCYDDAIEFPYDSTHSIMRYYRSGKEIIRQADVYLKEGNDVTAYILYIRSMTIYIEKLPKHPDYPTTPQSDKEQILKIVKELFPKIEELKKKLLKKFQADYIKFRKAIEEQQRIEAEKLLEKLRLEEEEKKKEKKSQLAASALQTPQFKIIAGALSSEDNYKLENQVLHPKAYITPHYEEQAKSTRDRKVPSVDRSTKPTSLPSNDRLREMIIPSKLMGNFLSMAFNNTLNNVETCGILVGKLEQNKLIVTHFLIPKQTGSPDSCITHNEEDIFDFQDQHNLITLGWIHTHPTQTAFLSSVDLHTHCSYQLMMAESIAIVCAPKYDETGFFHLTPDYGLNYIANCRETGFHPHSADPQLYTTAKHFKLDMNAPIQAIDLRKK